MPDDDHADRLPNLSAWLTGQGYGTDALNYRLLREAAQGGKIPAFQARSSRIWHFRRRAAAAIAAALGLPRRAPDRRPAPERQKAAVAA